MLNNVVTNIDWSRKYVAVETNIGTIQTRSVLLTVSTGVLAGGRIKFVPQLPVEKVESFHAISMGFYDHIALLFSEDVFGLGADGYVLHKIGADGKGFGTLTNASGTGLAYCDVGGAFAQELARESERARIDYMLGELSLMLGSDITRSFVRGSATSWGTDPWSLGSYASAEPGRFAMREVLRQPVAEKIYFAGEACHKVRWGTVNGAYLSGQETARRISQEIGG